ncbi:MAG TPA: SGNH/GDSL hydrolase family protein [Clostridiales bacterium]|nr:SGNH/GDSL hydrolase family protein [Clostridiales bacterium]
MDKVNVINYRAPLRNTYNAIKNGKLTIGFIGGSITDPRNGYNWPEFIIRWFVDKYPNVRIVEENAAIGATGSELAVFRAEKDLIDRHCDLVFIEFAVNDAGVPKEKRMRAREGLIRKLLKDKDRDLVFVYTFWQGMYEEMLAGQVPESIKDFEELARYYDIGSVWVGQYALNEVKAGRVRWEEWLPDGLHPQLYGSSIYASPVINYLENELINKVYDFTVTDEKRINKKPLNIKNWENTEFILFDDVILSGPWYIRRWPNLKWIDQVLETFSIDAKLKFSFIGRGLVLGFDFGSTSAEFKYCLDGGEWIDSERDRDASWPKEGNFYAMCIKDDMEMGMHEFELKVVHGNRPGCCGVNFRIAFIGVIK